MSLLMLLVRCSKLWTELMQMRKVIANHIVAMPSFCDDHLSLIYIYIYMYV